MSILIGFFQNRVLFSAVLGWLLSQVAKMLVTLVFTRKLNFESCGAPSAHSSMVCALTVSMARFYGVNTRHSPFALCLRLLQCMTRWGLPGRSSCPAVNKYLNESRYQRPIRIHGIPDEK